MKKIFSVILFSAFLFSCSDKVENMDKSKVVGRWNVTYYYDDTSKSYKDASILEWYASFGSDGSYSSYSGNSYTGTYAIVGNNVVATVGSTKVHYDYISLSGNNAEFKMYYEGAESNYVKFKAVR